MKRNTINIWLAVLSSVTTNALAQTTSIESSTQTLSQQQSQHQQSQLSDSLKQAKEWGLTIEEWNRYTELMKGERGMWSPNLDPLTALGIEARTAEEREKYARMLAKNTMNVCPKNWILTKSIVRSLRNCIQMNFLLK
ncbi:hypothetical protein NJNGDCLN_02171 [Mannheimia haemolytica]